MSKERIFFDNFFSIGQGPSNVGELNWDLLGFFFIRIQFSTMWARLMHKFYIMHKKIVMKIYSSRVKQSISRFLCASLTLPITPIHFWNRTKKVNILFRDIKPTNLFSPIYEKFFNKIWWFFNDAVKYILRHLHDLEKVAWFQYKTSTGIHPTFRCRRKQKSK